MQKYSAYILFGAPGSGKGTQGRALGVLPGFFHCACGDVFRAISPSSSVGERVAKYSRKGELVPDALTIRLWDEYLRECIKTGRFNPTNDTLVLDGIPRSLTQARLLDHSVQVKAVIHLKCSERTELIARLRRRALRENRLDDANEEIIHRRLDVFEKSTIPLLEYYQPRLVISVDAQNSPPKVLLDTLRHIQHL